jgi:hypothetical protein
MGLAIRGGSRADAVVIGVAEVERVLALASRAGSIGAFSCGVLAA